jgi:hypothetical protein
MSIIVYPSLTEDAYLPEDVDAVESFSMQLSNPNSIAQFSLVVDSQTSADFANLRFSSIEGESPPPSFNGKYEGSSFDSTLSVNVFVPEPEEGQPIATCTLVSVALLGYSSNQGFSASMLPQNKIKVSGKALSVFTDQIYEFLMTDLKTVKQLSPDTNEEYAALIKWNPPRTKEKELIHTFSVIVTYDETGFFGLNSRYTAIITLTLPQTIRWNYDTAVSQFNELLSKGTI